MVKNKSKAKLQQISDVAWLVRQGANKMGILNKDVQDHYFYINGKEMVSLDNEEDVEKFFGNERGGFFPIIESPNLTSRISKPKGLLISSIL